MSNTSSEGYGEVQYAQWLPSIDSASRDDTLRQVAFRVFGKGRLTVIGLGGTLGSADSPMPTPDIRDYSDYYGVDNEPDDEGVCIINEGAEKKAYAPDFLDEMDMRLVLVERPGIGQTSGTLPLIPLEYTKYTLEPVLDALGVGEDEQVGIIAFSAGVPHALFCAGELGARVGAVVAHGGLSPGGLLDRAANEGVAEHNMVDRYWDWADVPSFSAEVNRDVRDFYLNVVKRSASEADRALFDELPELEEAIIRSYIRSQMWFVDPESARRELGRHPFPFGHMSDVYRNRLGYQSSILDAVREVGTPVLLVQGVEDTFTRSAHARILKEKLGEAAELRLIRAGHFAGYVLWEHTLRWLRGKIRPDLEDQSERILA